MSKMNIRYWLCQVFGWGGWTLLNVFIAYQFLSEVYLTPEEKKNIFFIVLGIEFFWSILATHLLRIVLKRINWMRFSIGNVIFVFIIGVISTGLIQYYGAKITADLSGKSFHEYVNNERLEKAIKLEQDGGVFNTDYYLLKKLPSGDSSEYKTVVKIKKNTGWQRDSSGKWKFEEPIKGREFWNFLFTFILCALWLLIYLVWHYINKNRNDQLDKLKLETTVKELELKTIKSHINPHFIFNSLNSIRALVDENPKRARRAITELSNILRSSMQAEKSETVPLEKELDIVKDYLALEHMRFEERLKIEMDIDEDTLQQPVPPMMLQTLVENAIKHGISKQIKGGLVRVVAAFKNNDLELLVQNTGQLSLHPNEEGFGIKSTEDRLNLMYQGKAVFDIRNLDSNMVQSKVSIPVTV
jgi:two-component system, LytTR family, sensor kinase